MYNETIKLQFLDNYTRSINTRYVATAIFNKIEKYEMLWEADLCTRSKEDLQPAIDEIVGRKPSSMSALLTVLKEYVKWCMLMNVPGACDGMLKITNAGIEKAKTQLVASPLHLQRYLDLLFEKESDETIDNVFRCYFWLAYSGIKECDIPEIKASDLDFSRALIRYKDTFTPIYREAFPALQNAAFLTSFLYKHPCYSKPIRRERIVGDTLMRGLRADMNIYTMRREISKVTAEVVKKGITNTRLSYTRARDSGVYYRAYEIERAGLPVSFSKVAQSDMEGKVYKLGKTETLKSKQNSIERIYMEEYRRWKLAFSV